MESARRQTAPPSEEGAGTAPGSPHEPTAAPAAAGIVRLASSWVSASAQRARLVTELAAAEARLAAISLSLMIFLAMLAVALVLGAWGLLVAGLVYGLLQLQVPLWPLLLVLGGLHALLAALAWRAAVSLSDNLQFNGTRRQIESTFSSATDPDPDTRHGNHGRSGNARAATATQG